MMPLSVMPLMRSTRSAAHQPATKRVPAARTSAGAPKVPAIAQASGKAASDGQVLGDTCHHGIAMRADFRPLADEGEVDMRDRTAARGHERRGMTQKAMRRRAAPGGIAGREMHADIAGADRAEDRVGERVEPDI